MLSSWALLMVLNYLKEKKDVKYLNPLSLSLFLYLAVIHAIMSSRFLLLLNHWSCIYANIISIKDKTGVRMSEFKSLLSFFRAVDFWTIKSTTQFFFVCFFMYKMGEIVKFLLHYGYKIHEVIHVKPLYNACRMPTIH